MSLPEPYWADDTPRTLDIRGNDVARTYHMAG
jgi:hypothetical protein